MMVCVSSEMSDDEVTLTERILRIVVWPEGHALMI